MIIRTLIIIIIIIIITISIVIAIGVSKFAHHLHDYSYFLLMKVRPQALITSSSCRLNWTGLAKSETNIIRLRTYLALNLTELVTKEVNCDSFRYY